MLLISTPMGGVWCLQGLEPRVIKAASEVTAKGYAKITLLGDPQQVAAEAKKLGADISGCTIVDPKVRWHSRAGWGRRWSTSSAVATRSSVGPIQQESCQSA